MASQLSSVLTVFLCLAVAFPFCVNGEAETTEATEPQPQTGAVAEPTAVVPSVVTQSTTEVAKKLEEALKLAQESLKGLYSDDGLTFVNSLLNTGGTISPWIVAFTTAFALIPPLVDPTPPNDQDLKILKAALQNINDNFNLLKTKNYNLPTAPANTRGLKDLKKMEGGLFYNLIQDYYDYSGNPSKSSVSAFVKACRPSISGDELIFFIHYQVTDADIRGNLMGHYEDSCNYTEVLYRSRRLSAMYMLSSQLSSFCFGTEYPNSAGTAIGSIARRMDEWWTEMAGKLRENLLNKKSFKSPFCLPLFTDSLESYSKKTQNQELGHEQFATGLAAHLYDKFPWINWYVFSYDQGLGGADEHFCTSGILSHCIQRKYGRNLFVAGQQAEDNYFYNRNCPAQKECVAKLDYYKNCEDATKPFAQCITEKCKSPAGTICKKSSDGFAAEKGSSASSDGWNKLSFGKDKKYLMHVLSP